MPATAAIATTSMNGAALNRRFTSRMTPVTGSQRPPAPKTAPRSPSADEADEPRERDHERDRRRDPGVDQPRASRAAATRGRRRRERRRSRSADGRAPTLRAARPATAALRHVGSWPGLGHESGRQEGEDQARAARQAPTGHEPPVAARHQAVGERCRRRCRRVQGANSEPREGREAEDREGQRSPAEELDGGNPEHIAERGRAEQGGRRVDERDAEAVVRGRRGDGQAGRPDVVDHRQPQSAVADHAFGTDDRCDSDDDADAEAPRRGRTAQRSTTRKTLTSSPSNAGSAGRKLGCSPWLSTPAAPSHRLSGSVSPGPGRSTTTHCTS